MTTTDEVEAQRAQIVAGMTAALARLARSRDWLSTDQRFAVAETLRNIADHLDRGRVLAPHPVARLPSGRLVRSEKTEHGMPLYRVVPWI